MVGVSRDFTVFLRSHSGIVLGRFSVIFEIIVICLGSLAVILTKFLTAQRNPARILKIPAILGRFDMLFKHATWLILDIVAAPFTWSNNRQHPHTIRSRLDKVCAGNTWHSQFPHAYVTHLELPGSDHTPIMLTLAAPSYSHHRRRRKPFRFETMWIRRDECEEIVNHIEAVLRKNDGCRLALMKWSKSTLKQPQHRIEEIQKRLNVIFHVTQNEDSRLETQALRNELEQLYGDKDMYWRQMSRVQWMKDGDRNTGFFHAKATARQRVHKVDKIRDSTGEWRDRVEEIEHMVSSYFNQIFKTTNPYEDGIDEVMGYIEPRISSEASQMLSRPFMAVESF